MVTVQSIVKVAAPATRNHAWFRPWADVATMLALSNARKAQAGKPCPVAARALERIEAAGLV